MVLLSKPDKKTHEICSKDILKRETNSVFLFPMEGRESMDVHSTSP